MSDEKNRYMKNRYIYIFEGDALGVAHVFIGPGLHGSSGCGIHFMQHLSERAKQLLGDEWEHAKVDSRRDFEAQRICTMLESAYEAGRESLRGDIRDLLRGPAGS